MKKIIMIVIGGIVLTACNNDNNNSDNNSDNSMDSLTHKADDDRNNRNINVYDSAAGKQGGDTASYDRMPNKISDSTPQ